MRTLIVVNFWHAAAAGGRRRAGRMAAATAAAHDAPKQRIKIGQIGTGHEHASGKMATFRKLSDHYEVVGIVEPDPELRKRPEEDPAYRGLTWMTEEQLLGTKGLQAVAVEVGSADDRIMDIAGRCIAAGMHLHLDKPGGRIVQHVQEGAGRGRATQSGRAVGLHVPQQSGGSVLPSSRSRGLARAGLRSRLP